MLRRDTDEYTQTEKMEISARNNKRQQRREKKKARKEEEKRHRQERGEAKKDWKGRDKELACDGASTFSFWPF
jgi:hypothetical protein